ncbi:MAG: hypothetical protein EBR18_03025 [Betaproteobacteria bacterium]|nr:hypothetical protein [Betaproteobacteria bacterium]
MFKPHELIQAGSADVPLQADADQAVVAEDVRRPEVKFARVWQADDLFEGRAPAGGFVSQAAAQVSAKRFALRDLDSIFLIGPRSTDSVVPPQPQDMLSPASADAEDAPQPAASAEPPSDEVQPIHSQQALDDARAQGYTEGMDAARAQLYDQIRAEIEAEKQADAQALAAMDQAVVDGLTAALDALHQSPQQFFEPLKRLSVHIAEQLVLGELRLDGSAIDRLVQRCVDDLAANEASSVLVELHPDDLHALHDLRKRAGLVEKNLPQLMVNEALPPGSVRASANDALVEDLITHRLAAIARALGLDEDPLRSQSAFNPERLAAERQRSTAVEDVPVRMGTAAPARAVAAEAMDLEDSDV